MMKHNKITETLGQAVVVIILTIAFIFALKNWTNTSYVTYYEGNDGYYPVEFTACEVVSVAEEKITIDRNGNLYSAYVDGTEICKGDVVWAGFASHEGNLELVKIHH